MTEPASRRAVGAGKVEPSDISHTIVHRTRGRRRSQPPDPIRLALARIDQGKLQQAIEHLREALEIKPDFAEEHYVMAGVLECLGRRADAQRHCQVAVRLKPELSGPAPQNDAVRNGKTPSDDKQHDH